MDVEAAVLTGGRSERMGRDKSTLLIDGREQVRLILDRLMLLSVPCTVLGRTAVPGHSFVQDTEDFRGPLSALKKFSPRRPYVFVTGCDVPLFDARIVPVLRARIGQHDACVVNLDERLQPLCGLYRSSAFLKMRSFEGRSISAFLSQIDTTDISEQSLVAEGIDPKRVRGANTMEEFERLTKGAATT